MCPANNAQNVDLIAYTDTPLQDIWNINEQGMAILSDVMKDAKLTNAKSQRIWGKTAGVSPLELFQKTTKKHQRQINSMRAEHCNRTRSRQARVVINSSKFSRNRTKKSQ